jgi:hypothetical protein
VFQGTSGILFHNNGDGTFTDITKAAGLDKIGKGLGVIFVDVDLDGKPDLYVANDTVMNFLFRNLGHNKFEDISLLSGAGLDREGRAQAGMGVDAGDLDGDGLPDIVVTNFDFELNSHYHNLGAGLFEEISTASGFGPPSLNFLAFGVNLLDVDNDGALDAYIANGHIGEHPTRGGVTYAERDFLMWNDGRGHFREQGCGPAFGRRFVGRGGAVADFDEDGDLDVAISNSGGPLQLLRNDGGHGGWIGVTLRGGTSNRQGIGARVTLETEKGTRVREVRTGSSYLSSSDPRVHFGLGDAASIKRLEIRWPSGIVQEVKGLKPGRYYVVEEPDRPR